MCSLTSFFAVPKGTDDIRIVYDTTKSGLNNAIWTPKFFLPTMASVLNYADDHTFYGDIDIGEMFLNYFLDPEIRPWAGVDVTALYSATNQECDRDTKSKRTLMRWERSLMGVRSSPYNCVRAYLISEEVIRGDRLDVANPFRWHRIVFNMPGTESYNPMKPWMYRFDEVDQVMAVFVTSYVDDLRTGSNAGRDACDRLTHVTSSKLNYLGEQDAPRKRGEASREPGAWAGSIVVSKEGEGLFLTISQEKWDKVRKIIHGYQTQIAAHEKTGDGKCCLDYKQLERDTGFLVHVFMTYDNFRPYLKGFYLTLNEWRSNRGSDGWISGEGDWEDWIEDFGKDGLKHEEVKVDGMTMNSDDPPSRVKVALETLVGRGLGRHGLIVVLILQLAR